MVKFSKGDMRFMAWFSLAVLLVINIMVTCATYERIQVVNKDVAAFQERWELMR